MDRKAMRIANALWYKAREQLDYPKLALSYLNLQYPAIINLLKVQI